jgi:hypothetical protein
MTTNDLVAAAKTRIHEIDLQNATPHKRRCFDRYDVREADEFHAGHPGAINIPVACWNSN